MRGRKGRWWCVVVVSWVRTSSSASPGHAPRHDAISSALLAWRQEAQTQRPFGVCGARVAHTGSCFRGECVGLVRPLVYRLINAETLTPPPTFGAPKLEALCWDCQTIFKRHAPLRGPRVGKQGSLFRSDSEVFCETVCGSFLIKCCGLLLVVLVVYVSFRFVLLCVLLLECPIAWLLVVCLCQPPLHGLHAFGGPGFRFLLRPCFSVSHLGTGRRLFLLTVGMTLPVRLRGGEVLDVISGRNIRLILQ